MNSGNNKLFVGKVFIRLEKVDSTNVYAKQLLSKSKPDEGTVIIAYHQTQGKGQFGKTWESEAGKNLTFSIVFYPSFLSASKLNLLSQAVSLALLDFFEHHLQVQARIKWPNDIYCHDKKVAGILIENALLNGFADYSIVGIGINVNQTMFSPELPNPTSLKLIFGKEFDLHNLMMSLCPFIEKRYLQLKNSQTETVSSQYETSLYRLNERISFFHSGQKLDGFIRGINAEGLLEIEINGVLRYFNHSEIVFPVGF